MTDVDGGRRFRLAERKLTTPAGRHDALERPRLLDTLDAALPARLVTLEAAAGFGKTTVLEQWIARRWSAASVAWFSVDERDGDPVRFWSYLCEAVRRLGTDLDPRLVDELRDDPDAADDLVVELGNALLALDGPRLLVVDDLHRVATTDVLASLAQFVESIPQSVTLAVTTRTALPWPTERWHARGELLTLAQPELAFSLDETTALIAPTLDGTASESSIAQVQRRTEGWPVAVQLLAHAIRRAADPQAALRNFDGADRVVAGFLLEEVLSGLPARLHRFLLDISVVDYFSADLASAIVEAESDGLIDEVVSEHLFVVSVDDRGSWFRLHHLIRDLLLAELTRTDPVRRQLLSRRAAEWFRASGLTSAAIEQHIAGGDHATALELIAASTADYQAEGRTRTLLALVEQIPIVEVEQRPAAAAGVATAFAGVGMHAEAGAWLDVATRTARSEDDALDVAAAAFFVECPIDPLSTLGERP